MRRGNTRLEGVRFCFKIRTDTHGCSLRCSQYYTEQHAEIGKEVVRGIDSFLLSRAVVLSLRSSVGSLAKPTHESIYILFFP